MMQVVLLSDYDGTISGERGICKGVIDRIEALRGLGAKVIVASARTVSDMADVLPALDGAVAENGAVIYADGSKLILDPEGAKAIRDSLSGINGILVGDAAAYVPLEIKGDAEQALLKNGVVFSSEAVGNSVILTPANTDKAKGAIALLERLKVSRPYYLVSVGDDVNDLSLFKVSDFSVLVSERDDLKSYVSLVTKRHGCLGFLDFTRSLLEVLSAH